jgi:excisionase family DNA binding protein
MALHGLPLTISVEHAAVLLGVSRSAAYRAAKAGQLGRVCNVGRTRVLR